MPGRKAYEPKDERLKKLKSLVDEAHDVLASLDLDDGFIQECHGEYADREGGSDLETLLETLDCPRGLERIDEKLQGEN